MVLGNTVFGIAIVFVFLYLCLLISIWGFVYFLCWVFFNNWNVVKVWIKKMNDVTLTVEDTGSKLVSCFHLLLILITALSWELFNWYFLILMFFNKVESIQWDQERHFWIVCFQEALNAFTCVASSAFVPFVCTTQNQKSQCSGKETIPKMLSNGQLKTTKCI